MENIEDYDIYNEKMQKSMLDKLFFIDKIDADVIIDFGCADGFLINSMVNLLKDDTIYLGYDIDDNMISSAKERLANNKFGSNASFYNDWIKLTEQAYGHLLNGKKVAVVLSSIIHEVYHYSRAHEIDDFWKSIFNSQFSFDYIVIRDMIPSRTIDRQSSYNDVKKIYSKYYDTKEMNDFESIWGSISNNKSLTHFLLKYQYVKPNWAREVQENYFPLYHEKLLSMIPDKYDISYHEHFILPYLSDSVKKNFNIEIKDNTHLKMILKRNKL